MAAPLKVPCPTCSGNGSIPHEKRRMENGELDPADFKVWDLCHKCGGSGTVPLKPEHVQEQPHGENVDIAGYMDHNDCCI